MKILFLLFIISSSLFAKTSQDATKYIQVNKLMLPKHDDADIGHVFFAPQFEEKAKFNENKIVTIELSYGEIDDSDASKKRLQWLKNQILIDKRINPNFKSQIVAYSGISDDLTSDSEANDFVDEVSIRDTKVQYDAIPAGLNLSPQLGKTTQTSKKSNRSPSGFLNGRTMWTLIRVSTITGGTYASIYYSKDVSPMAAFGIGLMGGLASGAITYYSAEYGKFLTSGAWTKWLFESDTSFSRQLRKTFKLDAKSLSQVFIEQREKLLTEMPHLADHPELFDEVHWKKTMENFDNNAAFRKQFLSKFSQAEEYFKWWVTDVAYAGLAMKVPQAIAGIGADSSLIHATGEILSGATMGVLAQGPGDIAIQQRKYQMIEELKESVISGKINTRNKQALLDEIEKVLAKEGQFANYVIHDGSHKALRRIENWARSRATMLSFFSVVGVGMEIAQIPLSRPILITLGTGGAFYYANVNQLFPEGSRLKRYTHYVLQSMNNLENKVQSLAKSGYRNVLATILPKRYCNSFFIPND